MNYFKTLVLLAIMGVLIVFVGGLLGGKTGVFIAFAFALIFNIGSYWFSDKIVLAMYKAKPASVSEGREAHKILTNLTARMDLPMPKLYIIDMEAPNAFATGRDPAHAVVALSPSLMKLLDKHEIEAVIAHELMHIKNRDILIMTIAATFATAIVSIAKISQFAAIFGGGRDRENNGGSIVGFIVLAVLAPLAATLIQLGISRTREYLSDADAARLTNKPNSLISALEKISGFAKTNPVENGSPATSQLFIINPMKESFIANLFSTHPTLERRRKNLEKVSKELGQSF